MFSHPLKIVTLCVQFLTQEYAGVFVKSGDYEPGSNDMLEMAAIENKHFS